MVGAKGRMTPRKNQMNKKPISDLSFRGVQLLNDSSQGQELPPLKVSFRLYKFNFGIVVKI